MLAAAGTVLMALGLAAALLGVGASLWSARSNDGSGLTWVRRALTASTAFLGAATAMLLGALIGDQFQIRYVALYSARGLPLIFKASALWAGQEGSLLFWALLQAAASTALINTRSAQSRPLLGWAAMVLASITAFYVAVSVLLSNPFVPGASAPADGLGLHPLLRHVGMALHPPALYAGYVGLSVPFALALSALITGRVDEWPAASRPWTLAAWLFLGLGLLLGARWAYDVLGWGGYWGWDPVENAGLMPWLAATALLHGTAVQQRRGAFRVWNLVMASLVYVLVLFGSFATRSGWVESVHAFSLSALGPVFLAFIGVALTASLGLIASHARGRRSGSSDSQPAARVDSRDGVFFLTLILLLIITGSIFVGTTLPTLSRWLSSRTFSAGPAWFERVTGPFFAALVVTMGLCPLLGTSVCGRRRPRERLSVGRVGGAMAHIGVLLLAVGAVGTHAYASERDFALAIGEPVSTGGYTLVVEELRQEQVADHLDTRAIVRVYRDQRHVAILEPRIDGYASFGQSVAVPAIHSTLRGDLYVLLAGWKPAEAQVTLKVLVNPLIGCLWLGGAMLLVGGAVAGWGRYRPRRHG